MDGTGTPFVPKSPPSRLGSCAQVPARVPRRPGCGSGLESGQGSARLPSAQSGRGAEGGGPRRHLVMDEDGEVREGRDCPQPGARVETLGWPPLLSSGPRVTTDERVGHLGLCVSRGWREGS